MSSITELMNAIGNSDLEVNCNDLEQMAEALESLRCEYLFSYESAGTSPMAELSISDAIDYLSLAVHALKRASYEQAHALASERRGSMT